MENNESVINFDDEDVVPAFPPEPKPPAPDPTPYQLAMENYRKLKESGQIFDPDGMDYFGGEG